MQGGARDKKHKNRLDEINGLSAPGVVKQALKTTLVYFAAGILWVLFSDSIVNNLFDDPKLVLSVSIAKGLLFILVTSALLFIPNYNNFKHVYSEKEKIQALNAELKDNNALLQSMLESTPLVIIFAVDNRYRYTVFNKRHQTVMHEQTGKLVEVGSDFLAVTEGNQDFLQLRENIRRALDGETFTNNTEYHFSDEQIYLQEHYAPITAKNGEITGAVRFSVDVTALKLVEQEKEYLSYHDKLTGLYNRRYYEDALERIDNAENLPIAIIMGDVNGLKLVNDAFGHYAGDELLKLAAIMLKDVSEPGDIIARWGGDEFIILLSHAGQAQAQAFVARAKEESTKIQGNMFNLDISFGWGVKTRPEEDMNHVIITAEDYMYRKKMTESKSMRSQTLKTIMRTLHEKNPREEEHSKRVGELCRKIAALMDFSVDQAETLYLVGYLHDVGKIAIEERILNKPGRLTDEEFEAIKKHTEIGSRIIRASYEITEIADAVLSHHERWDGKGYPHGLSGENIPIFSRIITVADSYDAMVSERPYKSRMSREEAVDELKRCAGKQFDPYITKLVIDNLIHI